MLGYHGVSDRWPADLAVTPDQLRTQLETLLEHGYHPTTLNGAAVSERPQRALVVTFDDGYRSVHSLAFPILRELGVPGTLFVVTGFAGGTEPMTWAGIDRWLGTPYEEELMPLTWDEIRSLAEAGWDIGSHTRTHPRLTTLDDDALASELADSRADLEAALGRCSSLAYPYGIRDARVVRAAREAGYLTAVTLPERITRSGRLEWPRVGVYNPDGRVRFQLKVSAFGRRLRHSRVWLALRWLGRPAFRRAPSS